MTIKTIVLGSTLTALTSCLLLVVMAPLGAAQEPELGLAAVDGWRAGTNGRVKVFNKDGTPQNDGRPQDLSALKPAGVLELNREFDTVKITTAPSETRWVQVSDLNLIICKPVPHRAIVQDGSRKNNGGYTVGSGAACP